MKIVEPNVDRKGKDKMDPSNYFSLPYILQTSSFDFGVGPTQSDVLHSKNIQKHVDSIISDVVTTIKNVDTEVFTNLGFTKHM